MKVGILAGGVGSRISEETEIKPKPMVEIGGRPILWHIMMHYAHCGLNEFAIALGYKGEYIKRYLSDYCTLNGHLKLNFRNGSISRYEYDPGQNGHVEAPLDIDWTVELVETGLNTATGGRIKRLAPYLGDGTFMLTWGDGVSNLDLRKLLEFHRSHGRLATVTAVRPPARFGRLDLLGDAVARFSEKPLDEGWINGAFFVLEPGVFDYVDGDDTQWEREPLERLAEDGQLMAYRHEGYWQCMDTLRDKKRLEELWESGDPPWKVWGRKALALGVNGH
jgi:glucose-1-phosphate cytidylyltransferase